MKAIVIHGKEDLRIEDLATPIPEKNQALIRVAWAGICGSDLHYYYDGAVGPFVIKEPLVPGHEVCGVIENGENLDTPLEKGTPVTVHPATWGPSIHNISQEHRNVLPGGSYLGSAATWPHTQGGMSEYLLVYADQIRVLPDSLPLKRAALAEPLGVALHALKTAGDLQGKTALVSGCGPIGLLLVAALKAHGLTDIAAVDIYEEPLKRAETLGAGTTYLIGSDKVPSTSYDVVFECSGAYSAFVAAADAATYRGIVVQVGLLSTDPAPMVFPSLVPKELHIRGSYRFVDEIDTAIQMLSSHPFIEDVVTHSFGADEVIDALK
ncbi:MAG: alcohol dehydrogenase catalytic domain-containing protein, partial [Actinomycetaceae bacterium]|nr:alcohol dehydrogenase catalytic domain-containing protein [Actinomycetaceae bacterium]